MYYLEEKYHFLGCVPTTPCDESRQYSLTYPCNWIDTATSPRSDNLSAASAFAAYSVGYLHIIGSSDLIYEAQSRLDLRDVEPLPGQDQHPRISKIDFFVFSTGLMLQRTWVRLACTPAGDEIEDLVGMSLSSDLKRGKGTMLGFFKLVVEIVDALVTNNLIRVKGDRRFGILEPLRSLHKNIGEEDSAYYWSFYLIDNEEHNSEWLNKFKAERQLEKSSLPEPGFYSGWGLIIWARDWDCEQDFTRATNDPTHPARLWFCLMILMSQTVVLCVTSAQATGILESIIDSKKKHSKTLSEDLRYLFRYSDWLLAWLDELRTCMLTSQGNFVDLQRNRICKLDEQSSKYEKLKSIVTETANAIDMRRSRHSLRIIQRVTGILTGIGIVTVVTGVTTFLMDEKNHHIFPVPSNSEAIAIFLIGSIIAIVCALVIAIKSGDV